MCKRPLLLCKNSAELSTFVNFHTVHQSLNRCKRRLVYLNPNDEDGLYGKMVRKSRRLSNISKVNSVIFFHRNEFPDFIELCILTILLLKQKYLLTTSMSWLVGTKWGQRYTGKYSSSSIDDKKNLSLWSNGTKQTFYQWEHCPKIVLLLIAFSISLKMESKSC